MGYFVNFPTTDYDINGDGVLDNLVNLTAVAKISDELIANASYYDMVTIQDGERPEQLSYRLYGSTEYYWTFLMINSGINNIWNDWPKSSSQLLEYCERKYEGVAAMTEDSLFTLNEITGDYSTKFEIGEQVTAPSGALATIRGIHRNNNYLVLDVISGEFESTGETIYGTSSQDSIACSSILSAAYAPKYHIDTSTGVPTQQRSAGTYAFTNLDFETMLNDQNRLIKVIKPTHIADIAAEFKSEMS